MKEVVQAVERDLASRDGSELPELDVKEGDVSARRKVLNGIFGTYENV